MMKLPSSLQVAAVFVVIILTCYSTTSEHQADNGKDPLLRLLMSNPIYREHVLDPPRRQQDTLLKLLRHSGASDLKLQSLLEPPGNSLSNDNSRASKELLVAPAYTQDPLLRQLLSKYHEDFLSALTPPDDKQNPLSQQVKSKKNGIVKQPQVQPQKNKNPLMRNLSNVKQETFNPDIISVPGYRQDPLLRLLRPEFESDENIFSPPAYKQDPLLRQLSGKRTGNLQLKPPKYKQDPLLRMLPSKSQKESFHGALKAPSQVTTKEAMLTIMRKEKERLQSIKADRILNLVSSQNSAKTKQRFNSFSPPVYAQDPLLRQLTNTPSNHKYDFLEPPQSEVNFQSLLVDLTNAVETFKNKELGKQQVKSLPLTKNVEGGVDFSLGTLTDDGRLCVIKEDSIESLEKEPILQCSHSNEEKCHYTYITFFTPVQEEFCEDNFEKKCQITFRKEASAETIKKCYKPLRKECNGQGPTECRTEFETSCSTKYVEESLGNYVGDTRCEKVPIEVCGQGCVTQEGDEECHEKNIDTLVDVPEEICDLTPQKTCRHVTKLVPSLRPRQECTTVPKEVCNLSYGQGKVVKTPLRTEWCLESAVERVEPRTEGFSSNSFSDVLDNAAYTQGLVRFRQ